MCDSCPNLGEKGFLGRCFWWPFAGTPIASTEESGTTFPEMKLPGCRCGSNLGTWLGIAVGHPSGVVFGMVGTAA